MISKRQDCSFIKITGQLHKTKLSHLRDCWGNNEATEILTWVLEMHFITGLTPPTEYFPLLRKAGGEGEDHMEATALFSLLWQAGYTLGWGSLLCRARTGTLSTSPASGFTKYLASSLIIFGMKTALSKCHEPPFSLIKLTTSMEPEGFLNMRNHSMKYF